VGAHSAANATEDRPDLVFLLGSRSLGRLVIVELKSANKELADEHLTQLLAYMRIAKDWLGERGAGNIVVHGQLIGSLGSTKSRARGVLALRERMSVAGPETPWKARDYAEVLLDTELAHQEILTIQRGLSEQADAAT